MATGLFACSCGDLPVSVETISLMLMVTGPWTALMQPRATCTASLYARMCRYREKETRTCINFVTWNRCAWFKSDTMHPVTYLQVTWSAYSHIAEGKKESHCMMAWNWAPSHTPVHTNPPTYLPVAWQRLNLWLLSNGQCVRQWLHFCLGLSLRVYRALSPQCVSTICSKMMTKINTHTAVLSHSYIPNHAEADFRPRDTVNALTAARNFFFPRVQELGSDQPAERANFRSDVSRCDMAGGLEEATARLLHVGRTSYTMKSSPKTK